MSEKLNEILTRTGKHESDEGEDLGKCASRPVTKYVPAFHVKMRGSVRSFDYGHMGLKKCEPDGFVIEFHEPEHWRLTVTGRNLWPIYNYLCLHRLEWIESADYDFAGDKELIINSIAIEPVLEENPNFCP